MGGRLLFGHVLDRGVAAPYNDAAHPKPNLLISAAILLKMSLLPIDGGLRYGKLD
jgi:hypothetical protein